MGEPATPTAADRAATRALATAIVESVRNDEAMPLGLTVYAPRDLGEAYIREAVEDLAFTLAQEIELQRDDLQRTYDTVCALTLLPNLDRSLWASLCNLHTQLSIALGRANPDIESRK